MKPIYKRIQTQCQRCGTPFETSENRVAEGRGKFCSKSCGTATQHTKHGHAKNATPTKTYSTWLAMRQRCENPQHASYAQYGGRGITVSSEWQTFEAFLADMGEKPNNTSLDRIDNSKGYFKLNCRWATRHEQQANISSNVHVIYQGKPFIIATLARHLGVNWMTLKYRINANWPEEKWGKPTTRT